MPAGLEGLVRGIAVDFAKMADPRNERKTVSPEVAASREEGRKELMSLLIDAKLAARIAAEAAMAGRLGAWLAGQEDRIFDAYSRLGRFDADFWRVEREAFHPIVLREVVRGASAVEETAPPHQSAPSRAARRRSGRNRRWRRYSPQAF